MKKNKILILIVIFSTGFSTGVFSQTSINWLTWESMIQKQKVQKKKIIIDLYTDWCGWCKKMDKTTFENPVIVKYINDNYYAVKFNAEQKEELEFKGYNYKFVNQGRRGYHEFAAALTKNNLSFPTYVFMNEDNEVLQVIPGYQDAKTFEYIINFFGGGYYINTPWTQFQEQFHSKL